MLNIFGEGAFTSYEFNEFIFIQEFYKKYFSAFNSRQMSNIQVLSHPRMIVT